MDKFKRFQGEVEVTAKQLAVTQEWEQEHEKREV